VKLSVHLRDTKTGLSGVLEQEWEYDEDGVIYQYDQGNYGCDCNRSCFLAEANPAFDDDEDDIDCNSGPNRVAIDRIENERGALLYSDTWRDR
jgi:hypothetical protein